MQQQQPCSDWELCKENIQPLRKGRRMENIKSALFEHADGDRRRATLLQQQREYEVALRTYVGDDPLQPWCAYIEWTEQNFPTGGKESRLLDLLQNCISTFHGESRYHNDARFVRIWLNIADMSPDPVEIYEFMFNQEIGCKSAFFYRDWALHLENLGNVKKAEEVLHEGLKMATEDKELKAIYTYFITRLANKNRESNEDNLFGDAVDQRAVLGGLKPSGKNKHVGPTRTGAAKINICQGIGTQIPRFIKPQTAVPIYCDENDPMSNHLYKSNCKAVPFAISDSKKENERQIVKWTQVKVKQKPCPNPSGSKFPIHVDEGADQPTPEISKKPYLAVLRNIDQPTVLKAVQKKMTAASHDNQRIMYCKEVLYRGITEFQFEELRAVKWRENRMKLEAEQQLKVREEMVRKREEQLRSELECLKNVLGQKNFCQLEEIAKRLEINTSLKVTANVDDNTSAVKSYTPLLLPPESSNWKDGESAKLHSSITPHSHTLHCMRALWNDEALSAPNSVLQSVDAKVVDFKPYEDEEDCKSFASKEINNPSAPVDFKPYEDEEDCQSFASKEINNPSAPVEFKPYEDEDCKPSMTKVESIPSNLVEIKIYEDEEGCRPSTSKDVNNPSDPAVKDLNVLQHQFSSDPQCEEQCTGRKSLSDDSLEHFADEENLQNIPPEGYIQPIKDRTLAGVLLPSLNIPYLPIEEQEELVQEEEDLDGIEPLNGCLPTEFTVTCPSKTIFLSNVKWSSTPNVEVRSQNLLKEVTGNEMNIGTKSSLEIHMRPDALSVIKKPFTSLTRANGGQFQILGRDLSAISETSREYKSSSSSGASSGATTQFKSHMLSCRNEALVEMSAEEGKHLAEETPNFLPTNVIITATPSCEINPFNATIIERVIMNLKVPLEDREGYTALPHNMPTIKERTNLILGNATYFIKQLTATGGFSKVYSGAVTDDDYLMCPKRSFGLAFKVQKPACLWEFYITTEIRRRLQETPRDFNIIPSIMDISKFYVYKNGSILVTDYYANGTLLDLANLCKTRGNAMPECLILYFTIEMLYIIEQLHSCKIIHGDVKPDNFIVMALPLVYVNRTKLSDCIVGNSIHCLKLIDYGRSIDMAVFPSEITFDASVNTSGFQCHEMQLKRPWTYQTDYYGMACCTHVLMFGAYMKTTNQNGRWKITSTFKRYWHKELWDNYFDCLLNIPSCSQQPDIATLRQSLQMCLMQDKLLAELPNQIRILADMLPSKKSRQ